MSTRSVIVTVVVLAVSGGRMRAASSDAPATAPSYLGDAVVVGRGGETPGWNLRVFGGAVVGPALASPRSDVVAYLAIGGHLAIGSVYHDVGGRSRAAGTWSVGPELRLGIAWAARRPLRGHVAVSPMWLHVDDTALPNGGGEPGLRIAIGLRVAWFGNRVELAGDIATDQPAHADFGSASGYMGADTVYLNLLAAVVALVLPDTIEVTYERAGGVGQPGVGLGWSL